MIDLDMIQPFIAMFRKLDVDGSGRLGMEDLKLHAKMSIILNSLDLTRCAFHPMHRMGLPFI